MFSISRKGGVIMALHIALLCKQRNMVRVSDAPMNKDMRRHCDQQGASEILKSGR